MCGRFASFKPPEAMRALFRTTNPLPSVAASWNIAPSQDAMVVRLNPETGERNLDLLTWGLVPHWTKDLKEARRPINARAETVASSPMFMSAFQRRRALVCADTFFEWQARENGPKQPYTIARHDGETMAFAGIWEGWKAETGKVIRSFTIITTPANQTMKPIHDRMPVILNEASWRVWLGEQEADAGALLQPAPDDLLEVWPVGLAVNSPRNNGPELLRPTHGG
jgi:putative SOS response-associated peptidase YedK